MRGQIICYANAMNKVIIYTDGGARGNPGPAAIGAQIQDEDGKVLKEVSETIGNATNNIAEYAAVVEGLRAAKELARKPRKWSLKYEWIAS